VSGGSAERRIGEQLHLYFYGKKLTMPVHVEPVLRYIRDAHGAFQASELPGQLDDEGRLVLIRRLIMEGAITMRVDQP
jgi:hypothetical protein